MSTSLAYRALIRGGVFLAPLLARSRPKVRAGLSGRAGVVERIAAWGGTQRDRSRPLLWMHAASVGEGLQAEAVLLLLRQAHPDWQIVFTYFSPSAATLAARQPADLRDCLPWDRPREVESVLDALTPTALVFSKLDLWPELATRAATRGVAVGIIAATVSPHARRLRWPARMLLRPGYQAVALAGAITEADARRLSALGVAAERIELTGDPRFDSAWARARANDPNDPLLRYCRGAPTLVAGSTWPEDEDVLLDAFKQVRATRPDARLLLVPHEPTEPHLARLEEAARRQGLEAKRLSDSAGAAPLLVVDQVGILATLYAGATLAYVGGGYGRTGLHSVLEPAACGVAVLFGPRWQGSPDAAGLLACGGATEASHQQGSLAAIWLGLLQHPEQLGVAGRRGLEYVEAGLGAAARSAGLVERLVSRGLTARDRRSHPERSPSSAP